MSAFVRPRAPDGHTPAVAQIAIVALVGLGVGVGFGLLVSPLLAPLAGWDVAAATWLAIVWSKIWPMDAARTARLAAFEDPNRAIRDIVLVGAGVASLLAVVMVIAAAAMAPRGVPRDLYGAAGVVSVLLSWLVVHTVFTARYARVYYTGPDGGVDFHQAEPPCYADFAYLAFTVGATFQVSDTNLTSPEMRRTVLMHSLLSYLFGAFVVAVTVNLLAGLA
ncbi:DUF1345 domain-containing protein [Micromonospora globbae]|uniref:DUF1345 domain-containing protein n=1 Tax=Micromonospora globbae TaxID=1894969 RepID=A0A420F748_9ACTN|nr:DUF1345 domain-containing protein [Micromonospora globbae]RKF28746.1 DUF1345 domain-containing protein [Micromonospora globbae]WTF83926.1 DUF1345 domain-containing protein [Micromonospora globbae]